MQLVNLPGGIGRRERKDAGGAIHFLSGGSDGKGRDKSHMISNILAAERRIFKILKPELV